MILIVGLGNPGKQYEQTRHNIGFDVIDYMANKYNIDVNREKFKGICGEGFIENKKVILLKPLTYMNLSGESIRELANFYKLEDDEIIVDDGLFYACESSVEITAHMNKSLSSMVLGNEGVFQTKLSGNGIVVLEIPVPEEEVFKCKINNDVLKVDGNFSILRTGDIEFTVEKSSKSLVSTATGGEGLLNVFRGTGEVWLIPTKSVYEKLEKGWNSLRPLTDPKGSSNTKV